jgi:hypothetical protein
VNVRCRPISDFPAEFKAGASRHFSNPFRSRWEDTPCELEPEPGAPA